MGADRVNDPAPEHSGRVQQLMRFALFALRVVASTVALVSLLRSQWFAGLSASLAWFVFVQVERRGLAAASSDSSSSVDSPSSGVSSVDAD